MERTIIIERKKGNGEDNNNREKERKWRGQ